MPALQLVCNASKDAKLQGWLSAASVEKSADAVGSLIDKYQGTGTSVSEEIKCSVHQLLNAMDQYFYDIIDVIHTHLALMMKSRKSISASTNCINVLLHNSNLFYINKASFNENQKKLEEYILLKTGLPLYGRKFDKISSATSKLLLYLDDYMELLFWLRRLIQQFCNKSTLNAPYVINRLANLRKEFVFPIDPQCLQSFLKEKTTSNKNYLNLRDPFGSAYCDQLGTRLTQAVFNKSVSNLIFEPKPLTFIRALPVDVVESVLDGLDFVMKNSNKLGRFLVPFTEHLDLVADISEKQAHFIEDCSRGTSEWPNQKELR